MSNAVILPIIGIEGFSQVFVPLTVNSPSSAASNTSMLRDYAASLLNVDTTRLTVVFPDGDVFVNGVVTWRVPVNQVQATSTTPNPERCWPTFSSTGKTTFRWTGGQFNGAMWKFENETGGGESTNLKFQNLRFSGPGNSVISTSVATAMLAGAGSVVVAASTGSNFVIGDAICIAVDDPAEAYSGTLINRIRPPWWATVTSVAGDTVSFLPVTCNGFTVAIGNRVQRWKQNRAIEIGGTRPLQDIFFYTEFDRCAFMDWFSAVATNDCSTLKFGGHCVWARCTFGVEEGYNSDVHKFDQPNLIYQIIGRTGSVVSGNRDITGLAGAADISIGTVMSDTTAPATAQAFPPYAVVESILSATSVRMTHVSTLTGSRSFMPHMGTFLAIGQGHSPWYPRSSATFDGRRDNADQIIIENPIVNHFQRLYAVYSDSNSGITVNDMYSELNQSIAIFGHVYGNSARGPYNFNRAILSGQDTFVRPVVECAGAGVNVSFSDFNSAGALPMPLYASSLSSSDTSIHMNRASVGTALGGIVWPDRFVFNGVNVPVGASAQIYAEREIPSNIVERSGNVSGGISNNTNFWDGATFTMTGATTFSNQSYGTPVLGRRFRIVAGSTGAHILTMGTNFRQANRTAIGAIAVSAAGTFCVMDFIGTGSQFVLTNHAAAPVFV